MCKPSNAKRKPIRGDVHTWRNRGRARGRWSRWDCAGWCPRSARASWASWYAPFPSPWRPARPTARSVRRNRAGTPRCSWSTRPRTWQHPTNKCAAQTHKYISRSLVNTSETGTHCYTRKCTRALTGARAASTDDGGEADEEAAASEENSSRSSSSRPNGDIGSRDPTWKPCSRAVLSSDEWSANPDRHTSHHVLVLVLIDSSLTRISSAFLVRAEIPKIQIKFWQQYTLW